MFRIHFAVTVNVTLQSFEFEMSCMSDITSLAFSFHTPTFFTKVRISWNRWPLFSRWLQLCDVCLRLGSRVCVWTIWIDVKLLSVDFGALLVWFDSSWFFFNFFAGGHSISLGLCPTKLPVKWDIRLGQLDVPALISIFVNGNRLSQVPACRFQFFLDLNHCTVFAIWITADLVRWNSCI